MSDLIKQTREYADLSEVVNFTYYDDHEKLLTRKTTIGDVLDFVCDDYTVMLYEEPKNGKWKRLVLGTKEYGTTVMYKCSECEEVTISRYSFCPNCGAKMAVVE